MSTSSPTRRPKRAWIEHLQRIRWLAWLPPRWLWALFVLVNGAFTIGVVSVVSVLTGTTFVFPPLGATAFLFFFTPEAPTASPRNTCYGYLIGMASGMLALAVTGLLDAPPALAVGVDVPRALAAALSVGLAGAAMVLLRAPHPPAGATTLVVSLGLVTTPKQLGSLQLGVMMLVAQALVIYRVVGVDYPLWGRSSKPPAA